jgi:hypothetical protein
MSRACSTEGTKWNLYNIFVRKPEEKRPQGRLRRSWEDNIKMNLRDKMYELD